MNQKIATGLGTLIIIIIVVTTGAFVWLYEKDRPIGDGQVIQNLPVNKKSKAAPTCQNLCGDGECDEIVCMATGCPCHETKESCSQDCSAGDISTADWQAYKNEKYGFELKYPSGMNIEKVFEGGYYYDETGDERAFETIDIVTRGISVTSENEIRNANNERKNISKSQQCPNCLSGKALDDNFSILSKANLCPYTEKFREEVKKTYRLFSVAIDQIEIVDGIENNNIKACILKTVGIDALDVNLDDIYYRVVFSYDSKIVFIEFPVFPRKIFAETDDYLMRIESDENERDIILNIFEDYLNNPIAKKNIETYDKILSTFKFTK